MKKEPTVVIPPTNVPDPPVIGFSTGFWLYLFTAQKHTEKEQDHLSPPLLNDLISRHYVGAATAGRSGQRHSSFTQMDNTGEPGSKPFGSVHRIPTRDTGHRINAKKRRPLGR